MTALAANHPANIILNTVAGYSTPGNQQVLAKRLRVYEKDHDVTFTALDNDTLAAVREAYQQYQDRTDLLSTLGSCESFIKAVSKLLELQ